MHSSTGEVLKKPMWNEAGSELNALAVDLEEDNGLPLE